MRRRLVPLLVVAAVVLSGAPGAVAGEAESTVEGEVQRFSIEMLDGSAVELTVVVPEDGEPVRVRNEDLEDVGTGAIAEVVVAEVSEESQEVTDPEGGAVALDVAVLDETEAQAAEEPILAEAQGTVRMAHMVLGRIGSQSADSVTLSTLATDITHDVGPYWSDSTGGQLAFGLGSQTSAGSYGGWGSTSTCTTSQILGALDWSATIAGVAPTYNQGRHSVLYTPRLAACGFAGVAHVADGGSAWVNGTNGTRWAVMAHELGHTVTLGHSDSRVQCSGPDGSSEQCVAGAYGDAYDVMGTSAGGTGPLGAAQLDALGLLTSESTVDVTSDRSVQLAPVGGLTGIRFARFVSGDATYYVEYRGAVGRDATLATTRAGCPLGVGSCGSVTRYQPGVVIHRVDGVHSAGEAVHLLHAGVGDPAYRSTDAWFVLPAGRTFTTVNGVVKVTVTSVTSAVATVSVAANTEMPVTPYDQVVLTPDVTGNTYADVFSVDRSGQLFLFPGMGNGKLNTGSFVSEGWDDLTLYAPGDWNGDRSADLMATEGDGTLWLYPGTGSGELEPQVEAGFGWSGYRIVPSGDVNGDSCPDLLAMDSAGTLWMYPGAGDGLFGRRIQVGNGWNGFELYAAGDMNRDGRADILSIDSAGRLWFYAGTGGGYFGRRVQVGHRWNGFVLASGADLNGNGLNDLLGRDRTGTLWFYSGRTGGSFAAAVQVGSGW